MNETFVVGDHDFTRFSLIPSVVVVVNIPESFEGSWYSGQVHVGFKDAVFKPSSPIRHATELYDFCPRLEPTTYYLSIQMEGRIID